MPTVSPSRRVIRLQPPTLDHLLGAALALIGLWLRRARTRRELASLSARQMRDTGLDPARIRRESAKPFWRA